MVYTTRIVLVAELYFGHAIWYENAPMLFVVKCSLAASRLNPSGEFKIGSPGFAKKMASKLLKQLSVSQKFLKGLTTLPNYASVRQKQQVAVSKALACATCLLVGEATAFMKALEEGLCNLEVPPNFPRTNFHKFSKSLNLSCPSICNRRAPHQFADRTER